MTVPLLFLDVDGVINADRPKPRLAASYKYAEVEAAGAFYPIWYRPTVVDFLNELHRDGAAQVLWLTTWREDAPRNLAPALGLDKFDAAAEVAGADHPFSPDWWKRNTVRSYLSESKSRPFVWLDDDLDKSLRRAFADIYPNSLLVRPSPYIGLSDDDLTRVSDFLRRFEG